MLHHLPALPSWLRPSNSCLLCDESCDQGSLPICLPCIDDLPWLGDHCEVCALPLTGANMRCGACQKREPNFDKVYVPWRYDFPIDALISRFKHQGKLPFGRLLGELLCLHLQHAFAQGQAKPDTLIAVPLAKRRQRQRGFNQAGLLTDWLSTTLKIPQHSEWLSRIIDTPAQQQLDASTRRSNLRAAFRLAPHSPVKNRHIALIDDVLTTGATANNLALLLKRGGAARVDVYCLARTPRPDD